MAISRADAAHLLRRSGYGVSDEQLRTLTRSRNRSVAVDQVLNADTSAEIPEVNDSDGPFAAWWTVTQWWLEQMRTSSSPIIEKMTMFWHNHFVSAFDKVPSMEVLAAQHAVLRQHALGDFHALTQNISVDVGMLAYLDNWLNLSTGPQENFARELMELFTLGAGHYTEDEVGEMARAWTGYGLDADFRTHRFWEQWHDAGDKKLFGLAPRPWTGPETITEILRGVLTVQSSEFIAAKVFSHFAYPVEPSDPAIAPIASHFRSSGLNITELLRAVLTSDEFWSERARYSLVRSPVDWMVAGMQALDLDTSAAIKPSDLVAAGQVPFFHPDVDGWGSNDYWISTGGSWARSQWATRARVLAYWGGVFDGVETLSPAQIAETGFATFGIVEPSPRTRTVVESWAERAQVEGDGAAIPGNLALVMLLCPDFQLS